MGAVDRGLPFPLFIDQITAIHKIDTVVAGLFELLHQIHLKLRQVFALGFPFALRITRQMNARQHQNRRGFIF